MRKLTRLLPSLSDFAFLLPVIFLFTRMTGTRVLLGDGDTGWHTLTGEWILTHRQIPTFDFFSYTKPGQTWYAWEWLSDVLMALLHRWGGIEAIVMASILLICITVSLLYRLALIRCGNSLVAFAVTAIAAAASAIHWLARPHLFTLLFAVVFLTLLEKRSTKLLWFLPLLTVLWTNLHGGFLIGIVLTGAHAFGELASGFCSIEPKERGDAFHYSRALSLATLGCLAASFVNPYTWRLYQHLFEYLTNPAFTEGIQEFQPISFTHPLAHFFEPLLLLGAVAAFREISRGRFASFLLILAFAHLSLTASRNIPLFAFVAAAPVAEMLTAWMWSVPPRLPAGLLHNLTSAMGQLAARLDLVEYDPHWHIVPAAVVLAITAIVYSPHPPQKFSAEYDPAVYPKLALAQLHPSDRVFTDDEWGDYLIYHSRPARKVFVDGRSDFYGPDFQKSYLDILNTRNGWKSTLNSYRVDTILARVDSTLACTLLQSPDWRLTYKDPVALVFHRSAASF